MLSQIEKQIMNILMKMNIAEDGIVGLMMAIKEHQTEEQKNGFLKKIQKLPQTPNGNRFYIHNLELNENKKRSMDLQPPKETKSFRYSAAGSTSSKDIIKQKDTKVNTNDKSVDKISFSATEDSNGNKLSENQIEFFKDSKVRDNKGKLLVVYHSTNNDFNVFENSKTLNGNIFGDGFYFSTNAENIYSYGNKYKEGYLNILKPYYYNNKPTIESVTDVIKKANINVELFSGKETNTRADIEESSGNNRVAFSANEKATDKRELVALHSLEYVQI